jgi:molecular chaperone DnaK (HSP70)
MRIGIDFGTTRIVVAASDRGNFPLVDFEAPDGQTRDWFPSVLAVKGSTRLYGWEALAAQNDPSWTVLRSVKRYLRKAGPNSELQIAAQSLPLRLLLAEMMDSLRTELVEHSNLGVGREARLEAMLGVPANANSNQRFLTEEAARAAGFVVLGLLNEPSAAAIEFAHRNSAERKTRSASGLVVYDLGGGTFDVSLVALGDSEHSVIATDGIAHLGGDDFDRILADLALESAGLTAQDRESLTPFEQHHLMNECREKKEALNPNTRKVSIDLERVRAGWAEVSIPVDDFYEKCRPLIEATREVVESLLAAHLSNPLDTLYVTGGGSELPSVARVLRENFGRRVRRSAYMRSASAIGLAIRASGQTDRFQEQFTENFGLWREADGGGNIVFDVIFPRGAKLPAPGEPSLRSVHSYQPAHNIGHFRYLECSHLDAQGQPTGEITKWDEIRFAFDPALQDHPNLDAYPVTRFSAAPGSRIEEAYSCDSSGNLRVTISSEPSGYVREYSIGNWTKSDATTPPATARR